MKQSDSITKEQLINDRGWAEELIPIYIGGGNEFSKSYAINIEKYLTRIGIDFKKVSND